MPTGGLWATIVLIDEQMIQAVMGCAEGLMC